MSTATDLLRADVAGGAVGAPHQGRPQRRISARA